MKKLNLKGVAAHYERCIWMYLGDAKNGYRQETLGCYKRALDYYGTLGE